MAMEELDDGLAGRVAIVTGAGVDGEGIANGRAAAIVLGRAGAAVVCVGRRLERVERTAEMVEAAGGRALAVAADVSLEDDCRRVVETAVDAFGRIDLLDNNVGIAEDGSVVTADSSAWLTSWKTNVESIVFMGKYAIPAMQRNGGGAIVNIGSLRALRPQDEAPYATTKGAVISLTQAMAVKHGPEGIRVNCLVIGPVYTSTLDTRITAEQREQRRLASALEIEGTAWDTANAVRFLLSDHSRFITGQVLVIDGGVSLKSPRR